MRILLSLFVLLICVLPLAAEEFQIFEKDGRFGIKNSSGEITVPAVHDKLGWSDGSVQVYEGVIGFRQNDLWGLISAKNKVLTENRFYSLETFEPGYVLASIKGKFSNQLFYGLLDSDGNVRVSFNYFELDPAGDFLIATEFDQFRSKVGVVNFNNRIIIPVKYNSVRQMNGLFVAQNPDSKIDIYYGGNLKAQGVDSVSSENHLVCYKDGYAGIVRNDGVLTHDFSYKKFRFKDSGIEAVEFPSWKVYDGAALVFEKRCDSLDFDLGVWTVYMNGAGIIDKPFNKLTVPGEYELLDRADKKLFVKNKRTGKWSLLDESGNILIADQDVIKNSGNHFLVRNKNRWHLYNAYGTKVNRFPLQHLVPGVDRQFIAKRNNYWGVLDFLGDNYFTFKYDSIQVGAPGFYAVKFLNKWGIMDKHGSWKSDSDYDKITTVGSLMVAHKGQSHSWFHEGRLLYKNTFEVAGIEDGFVLVQNDSVKTGLLQSDGSILRYPVYDSIEKKGEYFILRKDGATILADLNGRTILDETQGFEDFGELSEGYIAAKKNSRWGFLDTEWRLRIANRYEQAGVFHEGQAPIMLRGRWGFINKAEELKVQPYYDSVSPRKNGLSIVKSDNKYGVIDSDGNEILATKWSHIGRTESGNYLIKDDKGLIGLADKNGSFILRPDFDYLKDLENLIIVGKNGLRGTLDYNGSQKHKIIYSDIRIYDGFLLLKN